jgi:hypothetical protein
MDFKAMLSGGDLRSIGKSNAVVLRIKSQHDFDGLFEYLFDGDRLVVMRAADAIEKLTRCKPEYLKTHKKAIIKLCRTAENKELQWHLALLVARLLLDKTEMAEVWNILKSWAHDPVYSCIVRVNAIQGLFELTKQHFTYKDEFYVLLSKLEQESVPSIKARVHRLRNELKKV